jgi:hypothetical protein
MKIGRCKLDVTTKALLVIESEAELLLVDVERLESVLGEKLNFKC